MKVALVIEHFDASRGGAERWTCQFAGGLLQRGFEVHVVCKDAAPDAPASAQKPPLAIRFDEPSAQNPPKLGKGGFAGRASTRIPKPGRPIGSETEAAAARPHRHGTLLVHELGRCGRLAFARRAEKLLRTLPVDVVHDMGSGWYADVLQPHDGSRLAQWEQKLGQLPTWQQAIKRFLMRVLPRYRAFRKLMHHQYSDAHRLVIALSRMCADDIERYHAVPRQRIRVIHNGVDVGRFDQSTCRRMRQSARQSLGLDDEDVLLLFVGNDFRRKGLETAVRALGRLHREGFGAVLAVAGSGDARPYLRLARQSGVAERMKTLGAVADILSYYAAADVLVLPTWYDPCSLSVLEAAACGLPSVTTCYNGAGELLRHGVSGMILSDPGDDAQLAAHLRLLMSNLVRQEMARQAHKVALRHTLDHNCQQIIDVYHDILGRKRKAA